MSIEIGGLHIINATPHPIRLVDQRQVSINRNCKVFLADGVTLEDATKELIPVSGISLTVQEDESIPDMIGNIRLYSQMGNARFNQVLPKKILDTNDIIVVSDRCARLLIYMANSIISGTNQSPDLNLFQIDKFYIPKQIVYVQEPYGKYVPKAALGLQQVIPALSLEAYATRLKLNSKAEYPVEIPVSAASAYKSYNSAVSAGIQPNKAFSKVEEYLTNRGILN